jgi:hypothetical protein
VKQIERVTGVFITSSTDKQMLTTNNGDADKEWERIN